MANEANVWARKYLNDHGYKNNQIGYDQGRDVVTADGLDFFKAPASNGKAMGSMSELDNAFSNLQNKLGQNKTSVQNTQTEQQTPGQIKSSELMAQLEQALSKPFQPSTFNFNPQSDPRYLQAISLADQNARQATGNALASLNARGIENSSIMGDRAAQIQQQERAKVSGQLVPELYAQAYNQFVNEQNMKYNANQDQLAGLANLLGVQNSQNQLGIDNAFRNKSANLDAALSVGNATGRAVSPQTDWSGLFRQAANPDTPLNFAGNQFEYGKDQDSISNAISQQNARTSAASQGNAASNAAFNRAMDIWKATGKAPAGIPGVPEGTPFGSGTESSNEFESAVLSNLQQFSSSQEAIGWLRENAGEIAKNLGTDGYQALQDMLPSFYGEGKDNSSAIRAKATEAAMKDYQWNSLNDAERQALINQYMQYYQ